MFEIQAPHGEKVLVPESLTEDFEYFELSQVDEALKYYKENGYVVFRKFTSPLLCDQVRSNFNEEIGPYKGYIYRQTGGNPEKHKVSDSGFIMNPILNVQDLSSKIASKFKLKSMEILTSQNVNFFLNRLYGESGKLVQSMYFEGNSATWAHQDTYYLDSENLGEMIAGWFAIEDIAPGAGRFFVYPKSHLLLAEKNAGEIGVAFNHQNYKSYIVDLIAQKKLTIAAPALQKGDVLFWNSRTIHGSLETKQPEFSRSSLTAHFIPDSSRFLQFQSRIKKLNLSQYNQMNVHSPKNADKLRQKIILKIETSFPRAFQAAKWTAVKLLVTK